MQRKQFFPKIKEWIKRNKAIDVVLFGSYARGKEKPKDIDLCILIKDKDEGKILDLMHSLGNLTDKLESKFHITALTSSQFLSGKNVSRALLKEGISIIHNQEFSLNYGLINKSIFEYSLRHFSSSKRVKFHYLLKGRYGSEGILKVVKGKFIGTGTITVPADKEDLLKEIFDKWDVKYKIYKALFS